VSVVTAWQHRSGVMPNGVKRLGSRDASVPPSRDALLMLSLIRLGGYHIDKSGEAGCS
jgi:hypothetical protein